MKKFIITIITFLVLVGSVFAEPKKIAEHQEAGINIYGTIWDANVGTEGRAMTFENGTEDIGELMGQMMKEGCSYLCTEQVNVSEYDGHSDGKYLIEHFGGFMTFVREVEGSDGTVYGYYGFIYEYNGEIYTVVFRD